MSLYTWRHQGSRDPSSCTTFTLNPRMGSLQLCPTLCKRVDCGLPGFSVREGGSPAKNTRAYWPILVVNSSRALYFLLP